MISTEDKLKCAEREVRRRKQVYPNRVETGRMSASEAAYELACMDAIAEHFRGLVQSERLL
jgi:hypothetical protein